jgi:Cd2+/Zn2+-exporting ATPase
MRQAWSAILAGNPFSIELLMIIAAAGGIFVGAENEAATVILLFLIGGMLESVAARRAQLGIQRLVDLVPQEAIKETETGRETVKVETLAVGDVVWVGAGQRVPTDGEVISGASSVDESPLTGESLPVNKQVKDTVYAGSINGDGTLRLRVNRDASDNAIARVARLVKEARNRRAPVQRFINKFAKYYTPMIVSIAVLTAIVPPLTFGGDWNEWIYRASALLLIGCPCALVISTPASLASALSAGAGRGLLLKGGDVLEGLANVDTVALDKTGTLTEGRPQVVEVIPAEGQDIRDLLGLAAGVSQASRHPVSSAVLSYAEAQGVAAAPVTDIKALPGRGVQGMYKDRLLEFGAVQKGTTVSGQLYGAGRIVSEVRYDGESLGFICLQDTLRADAENGIAALRQLGMQPVMLTGDSQANADRIAEIIGIEAHAELLPEDKMAHVQKLQASGARVVKVGDGINDAPALAEAAVGIAFGGGTDVALETADAASLRNRVTDVAEMIWLSRSTMYNIRQNITIALGLKGVFLVTTLLGLTGLWPAILADTGATVLVTGNALRLLRHKPLQKGEP